MESLQHSVNSVENENAKLKKAIRQHAPANAEALISEVEGNTVAAAPGFITADGTTVRRVDDPDYSLIKTLQSAMQSFVISDPSLPDNPIVYASQGFLALTGD